MSITFKEDLFTASYKIILAIDLIRCSEAFAAACKVPQAHLDAVHSIAMDICGLTEETPREIEIEFPAHKYIVNANWARAFRQALHYWADYAAAAFNNNNGMLNDMANGYYFANADASGPTIDQYITRFDSIPGMNLNVFPGIQIKYPPRILAMGEYYSKSFDPLPWANDLKVIPDHYARLSIKFPGQVSFYENEARMESGRRLVMKAGRYLTKFYPHLAPDVIRRYSAMAQNNIVVNFADTAEEISMVYQNGPKSCMSRSKSDFKLKFHPVEAYESPDLKLAYIGDKKSATARAIVWPEKKLVGRIYGDADRMVIALEGLGYNVKDTQHPTSYYHHMVGARIKHIKHDGKLIVPYVDCCRWGTIDGEYVTIGDRAINPPPKNMVSLHNEYGCINYPKTVRIVDIGEDASSHWAERHAVFCADYNEYCASVETAVSVIYESGDKNHIYVGKHRLENETFEYKGAYYLNRVPHTEVNGEKIPNYYIEKERQRQILKEKEAREQAEYEAARKNKVKLVRKYRYSSSIDPFDNYISTSNDTDWTISNTIQPRVTIRPDRIFPFNTDYGSFRSREATVTTNTVDSEVTIDTVRNWIVDIEST